MCESPRNHFVSSDNPHDMKRVLILLALISTFFLTLSAQNFHAWFPPADPDLTLENTFLFEKNEWDLSPEVQAELEQLARKLHHRSVETISVLGHADGNGTAEKNRELSLNRANAVAGFLINEGIPSGQIYVDAAGEDFPLAENDTETGRQQNRSVVMRVRYKGTATADNGMVQPPKWVVE